MTKEEKIKDEWDKLCPNSQLIICMNTGYAVTYCINGISDIVDNSIINEEDIDWIYLGEDLIKWRPKSLQGIENNNGWIKIESEDDLPNESSNYWVMQSDKRIQTIKEYFGNKEYYNITATHYQPIEKPKPPIY